MPFFTYNTPLGNVTIQEREGKLWNVYFEGEEADVEQDEQRETPILREANEQLVQYFQGERTEFNLPYDWEGTPFQQQVWKILCEIPYGEAWTYGETAKKIARPKAARAVGMACNRNRLPIFIPCHRVVGANGSLTGYSGGLSIKEKLLALEEKK